jgi:hypothetical protein
MANVVTGLIVCEVHNDLLIKCKALHEPAVQKTA